MPEMPRKKIPTEQMFKMSDETHCDQLDESLKCYSDNVTTSEDDSVSCSSTGETGISCDQGSSPESETGKCSSDSFDASDCSSYTEGSNESNGGEVVVKTVFSDVTSWILVNMYRRFRRTCRLTFQGRIISLLVHVYQNKRRHKPRK